MCGIFGYVGSNNLSINNNILPHRGPDDWGVKNIKVNNRSLTFFQSRLSIIGIGKQGHQPFEKYAGKILIYNGEVYNFKFLKEKLVNEFNINFITETDTEVLYEALINWGLTKTVRELNGMFAFSYFDAEIDELIIVRDNLGVKPLYYSLTDDDFVFSSEIKTFFELQLRKSTLEKDFIGEYFANGWIYEPNTLFKNIYKLSAGHYVKLSLSDMSIVDVKYWDINDKTNISKPDIYSIVKSQTISDVPIGNYFSGGVDSSLITYIVKDEDILNLNLDMVDGESERVKLMKSKFNLNVKSFKVSGSNLSTYERLIYNLDEPIADPAIIPAYLLAKESKLLNRTVMLSGMGGDEIDAGYSRHRIINSIVLQKAVVLIPKSAIKLFFKHKRRRDILRLKEFSRNPKPENYYSLTSYFTEDQISELILDSNWHKDYRNKINHLCSNVVGIRKYFYLDIKGFLASHNLIYMDKASMAASIEVRVPLLDKNLAQYFFRSIGKNIGKKRLTALLENGLKGSYKKTKKSGFSYDINEWLKCDIDWDEVIAFYSKSNLLNINALRGYVKSLDSDVESVSMKLWSIYTLYLWLKTFNVEV